MIFRFLQIAVPFVWFGFVAGISFLETPLKFRAPDITIPLGLGIGRLVFFWLNKIEIALAICLLIALVFVKPRSRFAAATFGATLLLLVAETVWLLPVLDARATEVINGNVAPLSNLHVVYIVFDALKLVLLFALGASAIKSNLKL